MFLTERYFFSLWNFFPCILPGMKSCTHIWFSWLQFHFLITLLLYLKNSGCQGDNLCKLMVSRSSNAKPALYTLKCHIKLLSRFPSLSCLSHTLLCSLHMPPLPFPLHSFITGYTREEERSRLPTLAGLLELAVEMNANPPDSSPCSFHTVSVSKRSAKCFETSGKDALSVQTQLPDLHATGERSCRSSRETGIGIKVTTSFGSR